MYTVVGSLQEREACGLVCCQRERPVGCWVVARERHLSVVVGALLSVNQSNILHNWFAGLCLVTCQGLGSGRDVLIS